MPIRKLATTFNLLPSVKKKNKGRIPVRNIFLWGNVKR